MSSISDNVERLVRASRSGDERSRNELLLLLEPMIRGFFVRRIGGRGEVDDLVQNTLLRVHQSLEDVREPSSLKSFAMKAALFELHDFYRGRYRAKEVTGADNQPEPWASASDSAISIDVHRALRQLSPHARRIVELREYGFRYAEIAEIVESTEAAIKMQVKRAFERMRELLACLLIAGVLLLLAGL